MYMPKLKAIEDRIVSVFIVNKKLNKIIKTLKDYIIKVLANLGINIQQIVKGEVFPMWDILMPAVEDCIALTSEAPQNNEGMIRVE